MVLMQEGYVEMFYKNSPHPILIYEDGSYFGDVSYLNQVRNFYKFKLSSCSDSK